MNSDLENNKKTSPPRGSSKNLQKSPKSLEEATLKKLMKQFLNRKKDTSRLKFSKEFENKLNKQYEVSIRGHIKQYQTYFDSYFKTHQKKLIAFDIEEINEQMVCACCITIWSPTEFKVDIMIIERIHYLHSYTGRLFTRFQKWLKNSDADMVIIHGFNKNEATLISDCGLEPVNTQMLLSNAPFIGRLNST